MTKHERLASQILELCQTTGRTTSHSELLIEQLVDSLEMDMDLHLHEWMEDAAATPTGVGAEWFYVCDCGARRYIQVDQGDTTEIITRPGEDA